MFTTPTWKKRVKVIVKKKEIVEGRGNVKVNGKKG